MPILRLTQTSLGKDRHQVEVAREDGGAREAPTVRFTFRFSEKDQGDIRWYLEDYLQWSEDPAPKRAARIEKRMEALGIELFNAIFQGDARDLWAQSRGKLARTRVEVVTEVRAAPIPWELLRDPKTNVPLALRARSFVRAHPNPGESPNLPKLKANAPLRILLVICRPQGRDDVPFRSVAARILKSLTGEAQSAFDLDVLRPPTFERLGEALRLAHAEGKPYQVVHFDGHGGFLDMDALLAQIREKAAEEEKVLASVLELDPRHLSTFSPQALYPHAPRPGSRGYLLFESPDGKTPYRFVDGPELGKLLVETGVPVLVLNACRSAHAEAQTGGEEADGKDSAVSTATTTDPHRQVRAWGSLAQEVMDAGAAGVVAMRYNVYVVTAAQFVADLYSALARGLTLGEAVTLGRKQLHDAPNRELGGEPMPLADWPVPVVYEAAPLALFPKRRQGKELQITIRAGSGTAAGGKAEALPPEPDAGFFGRDETLLALDRAFDRHSVVLLHAYAGSGKTSTAAEFARWYSRTGGVEGPVLFTSFERYLPLPQVLDQLGQVFDQALANLGVNWLALSDVERRDMALQILGQVPVLWIWDNVEPVAGFPSGNASAWKEVEQAALGDFLRMARGSKARFLLTSRREERAWLGDLPERVAVPPMPMAERRQLALALARKAGWAPGDLASWAPLLWFSQGNPLTVTVLARQALRAELRQKGEIDAFVESLRRGEAKFADADSSEGRSHSLAASLTYGFEEAFTPEERRQLSLLHLFQGFVDVDALRLMGNPEEQWSLPVLWALTRENGISLLDRAAEVGLLASSGGGYYSIHPALPWFFRDIFAKGSEASEIEAQRAFVEAVGDLSGYYHKAYEEGRREVILILRGEEANLLHARRLALEHDWWPRVISSMQALRSLYKHTGRRAEWRRLVSEVVPVFLDQETEKPLPGREESWTLLMDYRVVLAQEELDLREAERLQELTVAWDRAQVAPFLAQPPEEWDATRKNLIRSLGVSLQALGRIQRDAGRAECVVSFEQSLELAEQVDDKALAAVSALNLGHAYLSLADIRDLAQADRWYTKSLGHRESGDRLGRARSTGQLGLVALGRFDEAKAAGRPEKELLAFLNRAADSYLQALALIPEDAIADVSVTHNQLGVVYGKAGDLDRAVSHYQKSLRLKEAEGNTLGAAETKSNIARVLAAAGRLADALDYGNAALRDYEAYGDRTAAEAAKTRRLIEQIQRDLQSHG
jgi:tetratricopeptide (TPR) repeat protein